ncbi:autophagy-related protein 27 [Cristinia sonorae]|uniref:Autophagy-related protein 27 n=1 Tax=Cristinia sonorae TaxID=1940300 RepID=A0A8K0XUF3_9AGAR|nr:autophagy-related protein 27 [Cristinia sonorae]
MHSSRYPLITLALLLSCAFSSAAQPHKRDFDCHVVIGDLKYDLTSLNKEYSVSRTRDTPPTKWQDTVRFNLCSELKAQDGVAAEDQCPSGSRACLTKANTKGSEPSRITHVIPIANSSDPTVTAIPSPGKGLHLLFHGSEYPSSTSPEPLSQSFSVTLKCAADSDTSSPQFVAYDGKEVKIEWDTPAGCSFGDPPEDGKKPGDDKGDDKVSEPEAVGSGIGYFFLLYVLHVDSTVSLFIETALATRFLLAFFAYFALGAYYNYSTYGASGMDLIPHRDFWREVPYMLRDVVSHLCSAVQPRRNPSRGGYIAV